MAEDVLLNLIGLRRGMKPDESILVTKPHLDRVIRALELHPCREALAQALDRLEKVQAFQDRKRDNLPAVGAVIALLRLRIAQEKLDPLKSPSTVQGNPWPKPGQRITWTRYSDKTGTPEPYEATGRITQVPVGSAAGVSLISIVAVEDDSGDTDTFDALRHPWRAL